jgi:Xaa-Pro aminopeptidase
MIPAVNRSSLMSINAISNLEFRERVERVQALMRQVGMDVLLAFSTESEPAYVRYLSDYWPSFETAAVLLPSKGEPLLLIGPESLTYAQARSKIDRVVQLRDFRESSQPAYPGSRLTKWSELLDAFSFQTFGIAGWYMFPQAIYEELRSVRPDAKWADADGVLRQAMLKKSPAELNCMRQAAGISELGLRAVVDKIRPGMTEIQVAGLATAAMLEQGAEATGYPVWCCSGPNTNQAISRPTHRQIKEGEIIQVCVGAKVSGYSASIGRPLLLGYCPDPTREFLQVGCDAEQMAIALMKIGTPAAEVATQVHGFIRSRGYGDAILYGPAHGCGQMECEYPFVETSSDFLLEENMSFNIDIFLASPAMGFRWEDGVILHEGEAEQLTSYGRELMIL